MARRSSEKTGGWGPFTPGTVACLPLGDRKDSSVLRRREQSGVSTRGARVLSDTAPAQVNTEGAVIRRWGQGNWHRGGEGTGLALPRRIHRRKRQTTPDTSVKGNALSPAEGRAASVLAGKKSESEFAQSCPTLRDPMDCSLPCSSIHGIFQARVLEWIAIPFSRGSCRPRDRTRVSCIVSRRFTI